MPKRGFYFIIVLSAILMWSFSFPLIKMALDNGFPPITLAALRTVVFIPILALLLLKHGKSSIPTNRNDWLIFLGIGVFAIILPNILLQPWMIEGLAVYAETKFQDGRGYHPHYDMMMRTEILEDNLKSLDQMAAVGLRQWPMGNWS